MNSVAELSGNYCLSEYLLKDLSIALESYAKFSSILTFGNHDKFKDYDELIHKILERLIKEVDEPLEINKYNKKSFHVDDNTEFTILATNDPTIGVCVDEFNDDKLRITLSINKCYEGDIDLLESMILHGLLTKNEKISKFVEILSEYSKCQDYISNLNRRNVVNNLKCYIDDEERDVFFSSLTDFICDICYKVKPSKNNCNYKESTIINNLRYSKTWYDYVAFCKIAYLVNLYPDDILESLYRKAISELEYKWNKKYDDKTKTASEIRKEIKAKYLKFTTKFSQLFLKTYGDYLVKTYKIDKTKIL